MAAICNTCACRPFVDCRPAVGTFQSLEARVIGQPNGGRAVVVAFNCDSHRATSKILCKRLKIRDMILYQRSGLAGTCHRPSPASLTFVPLPSLTSSSIAWNFIEVSSLQHNFFIDYAYLRLTPHMIKGS